MAMLDEWNDRLSECIDGELEPSERRDLEAHLAGCAECRTDLAALRAVVTRAGSLSDTPPASDLWPGVAARIHPRPARRTTLVTRRFAFTLPQLVAASLALIVASGGMVWLARPCSVKCGRQTLATRRSTKPSPICSRRSRPAVDGSIPRPFESSKPISRPLIVRSPSAARPSRPIRRACT